MNFLKLLVPLPLLCWSPAHAQAIPGDWVYTDLTSSKVWRMDPKTGAYSALPGTGFGIGNAIAMASNNLDLVIGTFGTANQLVLHPVSGIRKVLAPIGAGSSNNGPNAIHLDQDGLFVCSEADQNGLHRVNPTAATTTPIAFTQQYINASCVDQDTGDYIVGIWGAGLLQRVNRKTNVVTGLASGLGSISGVDFEPQTGSFIVTTYSAPEVRRVSRTGVITPVVSFFNANAVKIDEETGDLVIAQGTAQPYSNSIRLYSSAGGLKRSWPAGNFTPTGIEVYASRKVSGNGPATAGSLYNIRYSFPSSPNAPYITLLSVGLRPGIPLNDGSGRVVNLNVSSLVIGEIPGITTGFVGVLDASGNATATIAIPSWFPAGVRLCISAVAQNFTLPSYFETANTWSFTTN